ncbi:MAG: fused MFS/spermidine synthase [Alphaproteobacteria bacterium]
MLPLSTACVFLGAFLLFSIQPLIGKVILPDFGGSQAVWTAALMTFQVLLLAGYLYVFALTAFLSLRYQLILHSVVLILSLLAVGLLTAEMDAPVSPRFPVIAVFARIFLSAGLPVAVIASTAPLVQSWLVQNADADAKSFRGRDTYILYAVSNGGALLGLLSYPFVVEPHIGLQGQEQLWQICFYVYGGLSLLVALKVLLTARTVSTKPTMMPAVSLERSSLWFLCSVLGVALLLATSNVITRDVASVPLLWILPLAAYLLSFVLTFATPRSYRRVPMMMGTVISGLLTLGFLLGLAEDRSGYLELLIASAVSFVFFACSFCHGEAYRNRPSNDASLPFFYLVLAFGGVVGGVLINLVAPVVLADHWEFQICVLGVFAFLTVVGWRWVRGLGLRLRLGLGGGVIIAFAGLSALLLADIRDEFNKVIATERSFHGVLKVYERYEGSAFHLRSLRHGNIDHGTQRLDPKVSQDPISYFGPNSGVGLAFQAIRARQNTYDFEEQGLNVGVAGLGIGVLLGHAQPGDEVVFYEIDQKVVKLAREYFSFVSAHEDQTEIRVGDARLLMEQELSADRVRSYDLLVIDVFNSDAIPVHLLTREALEIYAAHLKSDGVLALHISNIFFDLAGVVDVLAAEQGLKAFKLVDEKGNGVLEARNSWMLLTRSPELIATFEKRDEREARLSAPRPVWTDDFASLMAVRK